MLEVINLIFIKYQNLILMKTITKKHKVAQEHRVSNLIETSKLLINLIKILKLIQFNPLKSKNNLLNIILIFKNLPK